MRVLNSLLALQSFTYPLNLWYPGASWEIISIVCRMVEWEKKNSWIKFQLKPHQ